MVITGDFFGRMERFGITLVNELEAIHVLSHVPRRGTLMVSRRILGCKNTLFQKILDGNLEIYVLFGDDMENPLMFRVSCSGERRILFINQRFVPEFSSLFVAQRIAQRIAHIRSVLGVPCFATNSLHFEGITYANGD